MTDINVNDKWRLHGVEFAGIGDKPYFILVNDMNEMKMVPVKRGITSLRQLLALEEE